MGEAKRKRTLYVQQKLSLRNSDPWRGGPRLSVEAVHEAGHAMGRYHSAETLGYPTEQGVTSIDMGERPPKGFRGVAGMQVYWGRPATTFGPMWSKDIERFLTPVNDRHGLGSGEGEVYISNTYHIDAIAEARKGGADINAWATAKILQTVAGPLAESIVRQLRLGDIMVEAEMKNDLNDLFKYCDLCGYSDDAICKMIVATETRLMELWVADDRRLWRALLKLAAILPVKGIIDGFQCWEAVRCVFGGPDQPQ